VRNLSYAMVLAALITGTACGRTHDTVNDSRPDGAAVDRAAQVTSGTGNEEAATNRDATGTAGSTVDPIDAAIRAAAITTKVQAQFAADAQVKGRLINVNTQDGVITLSGTVMARTESDKAEQLARETDGVKRVVNNLKLDAIR
jgi:osmotically-inducible protein OsmY